MKAALLLVALAMLVCAPAQTETPAPGGIQTAVNKLDPYIRNIMHQTGVPGLAVAVVYRGHVVFIEGYGVRRLDEKEKTIDPDTVFEIASVSKPLAATIVASLVGAGKVSWDDRIQKLDPGFTLSDYAATGQLTIRDLLSHRSGLPTGAGDVLEDLGYSRPEILHQIRLVPLAGAFRETYHYSNFGYTEGVLAAISKTGKTWEEVAQQQLYGKIGMHSTSSRYSDYENNPNKSALHYRKGDDYHNWFVREADAESPAGGVSSSVRDLARFITLQLQDGAFEGQQVVDKAALEETHKPAICAAEEGPVAPGKCSGSYYGLGWNVGKNAKGALRLSHSGAFDLGSATAIYMEPSEQLGIVVLTNGTPVGIPEAVSLSFLDYFHYGHARTDYLAAIRPYFEKLEEETQNSSTDYSKLTPPANPSQPGQLSAYQGTYISPYYGELQIELDRDQLVLRLPPRGAHYELTHWDGDTFTYYFASENTGAGRRGVKFLDAGKQILVENLAIVNDGVFAKVK